MSCHQTRPADPPSHHAALRARAPRQVVPDVARSAVRSDRTGHESRRQPSPRIPEAQSVRPGADDRRRRHGAVRFERDPRVSGETLRRRFMAAGRRAGRGRRAALALARGRPDRLRPVRGAARHGVRRAAPSRNRAERSPSSCSTCSTRNLPTSLSRRATHVSIADIAAHTYIAHAPEGGVSLEPYPNIRAWLGRVEALPRFIAMPSTKAGLLAA